MQIPSLSDTRCVEVLIYLDADLKNINSSLGSRNKVVQICLDSENKIKRMIQLQGMKQNLRKGSLLEESFLAPFHQPKGPSLHAAI